MDRRDFMKMTALTGLALATPFAASRVKASDDEPYTGLFLITVHASGGWDPTSLVDPKGFESAGEANPMNRTYPKAFVSDKANWAGGAIPYAPLFDAAVNNNGQTAIPTANGALFNIGLSDGDRTSSTARGTDATTGQPYRNFFEKHWRNLLVLNGVDAQTNDHDGGTRNTFSSKLAEGNPSLAALYASAKARSKPMAFISAGGYDFTAGTVGVTRAGNVNLLKRIASPNDLNPDDAQPSHYLTANTDARIARFQAERTQNAIDAQRLPRWRNALNTLFLARAGNNELLRVKQVLDSLPRGGPQKTSFESQVQIGIAAYRAGIAASLSVSHGGFDTHMNHDVSQITALRRLLNGIDFIVEELAAQGVPQEKVLIMVGSDFGRTPRYNIGNGKDHWSTTSMMFLGGGIRGGRVIGASDDEHRMLPVNPATLAPTARDDFNGVRISPAHVGKALRQFTGIADAEKALEFPIPDGVEDMALFS